MSLGLVRLPFLWVLNGFLILLYLAAEHFLAILLAPGLYLLWKNAPTAQRSWMGGTAVLSLAASLLAPPVVGIWLSLMSYGAILALRLEKFNPEALSWRVVSGIAAYALIGIGFSMYQGLSPALLDPYGTFAQGKGYLDVIVSLAVFLGPLGFVGLLVQALFAHPPLEGTPEDIIYSVRTRGSE